MPEPVDPWAEPVPEEVPPWALTEVVPGLSQADDTLEPEQLFALGFDAVVDLSGRSPRLPRRLGRLYVWYAIPDLELIEDPETLRAVARLVATLVRGGRRVVVNCAAGLNRSGLVVARALLELGYPNEEAVALVRAARGPEALANRTFEQWLLGELRPPPPGDPKGQPRWRRGSRGRGRTGPPAADREVGRDA